MNTSTTPKTAGNGSPPAAEQTGSAAIEHSIQAVTEAGATTGAHMAEMLEDAKQRVGPVVDEMKDQMASAATSGKDTLASQIEVAAKALRETHQKLGDSGGWVAGLFDSGATEMTSLAAALRNNDVKDLYGTVEDLARRQPALFIGASFAAGFAMVRLGRIAVSGMTRDDLPTLPEVTSEHR